MQGETAFRVTAIVLFVSILIPGGYQRIRAAKSGERISRREEGLPLMVLLRLFGFATWIGLLLYMMHPAWMRWSQVQIPAAWRWAGAGLGIVVVPLITWMFVSLGRNLTDTVAIRREHRLVTHGPYRWVRHPMYTFSFLTVPAFALLSANWFIALTGSLASILLVVRTPIEETRMIEAFGDRYREYMRHTGRFIPRRRMDVRESDQTTTDSRG